MTPNKVLYLSASELLDTAMLLEQVAGEFGPDTLAIYMARAKKFRAAAEAPAITEHCCCCQRQYLAGSLSGICDDCYEDRIA